MALEISWENTLTKVAMFLLVQALVYLILSNSSNIFSKSKMMRSLSCKSANSGSIYKILALISDMPQGGEASPFHKYLTNDDDYAKHN
ncbi:hypothetical protein ACSBR2_021527 [Camellia fascicularis]